MLQEDEASAARQPENSCTYHTSLLLSAPLLHVPALKIYHLSPPQVQGRQHWPTRQTPAATGGAEEEAGLLSRPPAGTRPSGSLTQSWQAWQAGVKERREGGWQEEAEGDTPRTLWHGHAPLTLGCNQRHLCPHMPPRVHGGGCLRAQPSLPVLPFAPNPSDAS